MGGRSEKRRIGRQAADWALRLADGDLGADERLSLSAWTANPDHAAALHRAAGILGCSQAILRADTDFSRQNFDPRARSGFGRKTIAGAVILIALCLGYTLDLPLRLEADYRTSINQTETLTLADGTRVHLNGNSALEEEFDVKTRRIKLLRGQAYFEVAKDPSRPFVVASGGGEAKALGTAFDVNIVGDQSEVTVTESRVLVSAEAAGGQAVLEPGDRIAYGSDGKLGTISRVPPGTEAPWLKNRLVFDERPLASVIEEIFRRLPGRAIVVNSATARRLVSGSFDLSDPEAALESFGRAMGVRIVRAGNFVTVIY
jgi:transmembrane sensor